MREATIECVKTKIMNLTELSIAPMTQCRTRLTGLHPAASVPLNEYTVEGQAKNTAVGAED